MPRGTEITLPCLENKTSTTHQNIDPWVTINPQTNSEAWEKSHLHHQVNGPNNIAICENISSGESYWLWTPFFDLRSSQGKVYSSINAIGAVFSFPQN